MTKEELEAIRERNKPAIIEALQILERHLLRKRAEEQAESEQEPAKEAA